MGQNSDKLTYSRQVFINRGDRKPFFSRRNITTPPIIFNSPVIFHEFKLLITISRIKNKSGGLIYKITTVKLDLKLNWRYSVDYIVTLKIGRIRPSEPTIAKQPSKIFTGAHKKKLFMMRIE